jgi:hypothetical protein
MIPRDAFFAVVRSDLYGGHISQPAVDGFNALLGEAEARAMDLRCTAYVLATAYHETAHTMQPVREIGLGRGHEYGRPDPETGQVYYGRGYVQLTWRANYQALGRLISVDLVHAPDRALEPAIAAKVLFEGMLRGLFTGQRLDHYFRPGVTDWINARRIINGLDRATLIAGYAIQLHGACQSPDSLTPIV